MRMPLIPLLALGLTIQAACTNGRAGSNPDRASIVRTVLVRDTFLLPGYVTWRVENHTDAKIYVAPCATQVRWGHAGDTAWSTFGGSAVGCVRQFPVDTNVLDQRLHGARPVAPRAALIDSLPMQAYAQIGRVRAEVLLLDAEGKFLSPPAGRSQTAIFLRDPR